MPIYEYQCKACGHQLEILQKFSDKPLKKCPKCNKSKLSKLVSATTFQLKGTGWYATDFRDKGTLKKEEGLKEKDPKEKESKDSTNSSTSNIEEKKTEKKTENKNTQKTAQTNDGATT